jgi:hypothetical protein
MHYTTEVSCKIIFNILRVTHNTRSMGARRVGLAQLIRFLVVKLNYLSLYTRFDMSVIFTVNYSFGGR